MIEPYIYTFEELPILPGLLASGKAELVSAGEGYEGEFYVKAVKLDGSEVFLSRLPQYQFESSIFKAIARALIDDKTTHGKNAAEEWAEHEKSYLD